MRLTAAFLANHAEIVNGMLNVDGGFWKSTRVPPDATSFGCDVVVLCEVEPEEVGSRFLLHINAEGPSGRHWRPAYSSDFTLNSPVKFLLLPQTRLPIEPGGGPHLYAFRLDGQHERVDVPLTVHTGPPRHERHAGPADAV
ncbi:hypothetical protein [Mycolicibacterium sp. XJ1819]